MKKIILVFLLVFTVSGCSAQQKSELTPLTMLTKRATHTATLLNDGRVLIAGGLQEDGRGNEFAVKDAEIYDPQTGRFSKTGSLTEPRSAHTAALLPDGRVLIAGGWGMEERLKTAEVFDPRTGSFTVIGEMSAPRAGMTATLLNNGNVLITGGSHQKDSYLASAEIFDSKTNRFALTGSLNTARYTHTATLLNNGTVLIAGGSGAAGVTAEAEIYDPLTGNFSSAGNLINARYKHAANLLDDGRVLIIGGSDNRDWRGKLSSAEIYDPASKKFEAVSNMDDERFKLSGSTVLLRNGAVLIGGGNKAIEIYDPRFNTFAKVSELSDVLYYTTATLLNDGSVLITGGYNNSIAATSGAWIFKIQS
jgi:N-acetylneuraminic acid mutarotase